VFLHVGFVYSDLALVIVHRHGRVEFIGVTGRHFAIEGLVGLWRSQLARVHLTLTFVSVHRGLQSTGGAHVDRHTLV